MHRQVATLQRFFLPTRYEALRLELESLSSEQPMDNKERVT